MSGPPSPFTYRQFLVVRPEFPALHRSAYDDLLAAFADAERALQDRPEAVAAELAADARVDAKILARALARGRFGVQPILGRGLARAAGARQSVRHPGPGEADPRRARRRAGRDVGACHAALRPRGPEVRRSVKGPRASGLGPREAQMQDPVPSPRSAGERARVRGPHGKSDRGEVQMRDPVPSPRSAGERARVRGPHDIATTQFTRQTPHPSPLPGGPGRGQTAAVLRAYRPDRALSAPSAGRRRLYFAAVPTLRR